MTHIGSCTALYVSNLGGRFCAGMTPSSLSAGLCHHCARARCHPATLQKAWHCIPRHVQVTWHPHNLDLVLQHVGPWSESLG